MTEKIILNIKILLWQKNEININQVKIYFVYGALAQHFLVGRWRWILQIFMPLEADFNNFNNYVEMIILHKTK